jgi:hypothetical protein
MAELIFNLVSGFLGDVVNVLRLSDGFKNLSDPGGFVFFFQIVVKHSLTGFGFEILAFFSVLK